MELNQLKYFSVVAELENMSMAAQKLHVSQPSLSMTIGRLEDDLGIPLFDRIGGKIRLNQIGNDLLQNTNQILQQVDQMYAKAAEKAGTETGKVAFGISNRLCSARERPAESFFVTIRKALVVTMRLPATADA